MSAFDPSAPVRALVIEPELIYLDAVQANDRSVMRALVGDPLEAVNVAFDEDGYPAATMWLDEEGKLAGSPENIAATSLAATLLGGMFGDVFVGTCVLAGSAPGGPEWGYVQTDVPGQIVEHAQRLAERLGITFEDRTAGGDGTRRPLARPSTAFERPPGNVYHLPDGSL